MAPAVLWYKSIMYIATGTFGIITCFRIVADEVDYRINPRWDKPLKDGWPEDEELQQKIENYKNSSKEKYG